mmetsp:Transcript_91474/g.261893  ORF Transcript_91474/g.261893 Transcript_91474/m.261893 type:complete len:200 (-) Transcript_91474:284-883(-)
MGSQQAEGPESWHLFKRQGQKAGTFNIIVPLTNRSGNSRLVQAQPQTCIMCGGKRGTQYSCTSIHWRWSTSLKCRRPQARAAAMPSTIACIFSGRTCTRTALWAMLSIICGVSSEQHAAACPTSSVRKVSASGKRKLRCARATETPARSRQEKSSMRSVASFAAATPKARTTPNASSCSATGASKRTAAQRRFATAWGA